MIGYECFEICILFIFNNGMQLTAQTAKRILEGHSEIDMIKIHGGGGRHGVARVQIQGQNQSLDIKIVNGSRSSYKGNIAEDEAAGRRLCFFE